MTVRLTDQLVLPGCAVMVYFRLFAIGSQLSPEARSSGIEVLETDSFRLHCMQTMTGMVQNILLVKSLLQTYLLSN